MLQLSVTMLGIVQNTKNNMEITEFGENLKINGYELAPPLEGEINIYYGRIGQGKTSIGTKNILDSLMQGNVVAANWNIKWEGYDERKKFFPKLWGALGIKKNFLVIPKENFHFWNFARSEYDHERYTDFVTKLAGLTDIDVHLDEGHIPFDSYEATRMPETKRSAIFGMRHFNRSLTVYTQRANSVHINLRGNTNRFYKCEKLWQWNIPFTNHSICRFLVTEFQDLDNSSTVREDRVLDEEGQETTEYKYAVSEFTYFATSWSHFRKFDSKYLRGGLQPSQENNTALYRLTWKHRLIQFFSPWLPKRLASKISASSAIEKENGKSPSLDTDYFSKLKSPASHGEKNV